MLYLGSAQATLGGFTDLSISFPLLIRNSESHGGGAYPNSHSERGGLIPGHVTNLLHGTNRETNTLTANFDSPVKLTGLAACLWAVGGKWRIWKEPA